MSRLGELVAVVEWHGDKKTVIQGGSYTSEALLAYVVSNHSAQLYSIKSVQICRVETEVINTPALAALTAITQRLKS